MSLMLIQVVGHLGSDPEIRMSPSGQKITTFRMACNTRRQGKEKTVWWRVTIFGDRFDKMVPYLKKGSLVFVSGSLNPPEIYEGRDGNRSVSLEIIAETVSFLPNSTRQERPANGQEERPEEVPGSSPYAMPAPAYAPKPQFGPGEAPAMPMQPTADDDEIPF